ncbi:mRNA-decapping enzyme 1A [Alligator mississippiensis]|uniref:5'-(N(7)-methylguanosine 5'-triphospho)-[mRNA] hydrolase n=1 Tax=Alligator mississippiensis TaxID=8496 RepID=A0A151MZ15_ALLMI|nr:mRNA-decapping enzyme 1A [Alligator mississippiensis]
MSLAALKQHDPYITSIADVTGQVALYSFSPKANEWEKTDIEGTLFVYRRSASPYHGFTIVNRLNMHNLVEPVNKDLEFQLHEPFLLYRNASLSIYSIWFYDKNDCHRIAKLMAKVVEQEAQRSQQVAHDRRSPSRTNGCSENRPIDILEMLSKAKDEYERNQINDLTIISNSGIQQNANPTKLENLETSEQMSSALQVQDQLFQSRHKHLTVEELFGTSLPKEQPTIPCSNPDKMEKLPADTSGKEHSLLLPFSFEQSSVIHQPLGKGESSGVKTSAISQLATPESFKESHAKPATLNSKIISPLQIVQQNKEPEVFPQPKTMSKTSQVAPPQFATATTTVAPSILLSPSVFQQSATKSTEVENKATPSSPLTLGATEIQAMSPTVLSRSQLQETLIHLIKNDSSFLTTIHDVYLQVLTKNTDINL